MTKPRPKPKRRAGKRKPITWTHRGWLRVCSGIWKVGQLRGDVEPVGGSCRFCRYRRVLIKITELPS